MYLKRMNEPIKISFRSFSFLLTLSIMLILPLKDSLLLASVIRPTRLTCEYLQDPPVVDVIQPRLGWINEAPVGANGENQAAFEIQVATSKDALLNGNADLWKSNKIKSEHSTHVRYNGMPLASGMDCWWRVRVWNGKAEVSEWSSPAKWHMGLLSPDDWKASWIGAPWQGEEPVKSKSKELPYPAPLLRKQFRINKEIKHACIYATGLGYFELYCNGQKVSDDVLVPNQTLWGKRENLHEYGIPVYDNFTEYRVMYLCYDLTPFLKTGKNAIGAILGNGFFNSPSKWVLAYGTPRFIAQLDILYTDGSKETIVSDKSWKAERSPVIFDMLYAGEHYDARLEYPGWNNADFNDSNWSNAVLRKAPEGKMKAQMSHSDKVMERLKPVKIERLAGEGNYRMDFGEEISGWLRLNHVNGTRGQRITIKYLSESPNGTNSYTLSGCGDESYAARFTWFVFRSVEISGWPGALREDQITAEAVYTETETTGHFECSNDLFNRINRIWQRSQTDNMHGSIASDCPHRERSAYTGDGQVVIATVTHNFDAAAFYKKWIEDVIGAQDKTTGYVPNGAPWQPGCGGGVAWGAAITIMPWEYYQAYGDKDILSYAYEGMKKYLTYMKQWVDKDGIMLQQAPDKKNPNEWMNLGDWCPPGKFPPTDMVHTFYLWLCAYNTANTAIVLDKKEDATIYLNLAERTKKAFLKRFYNEKEGSFGKYGGNVFALKMGLPDDIRIKVTASLKKDMAASDGHLDTGIFGTRYFFEVLCDNGLNELAYQAMNKTTFPGFGYWIAQGATTTWEQWDGGNSRNHPMFGGGLTWFYRKLAGMVAAEPGYRKIIFQPHPVKELSYASYSKRTPYGEAGIWWEKEDSRLKIRVLVPVGSEALVYVPEQDENKDRLKEQAVRNVKYRGTKDHYACYGVGSGEYTFYGDLKEEHE